jgi:hypothetical protein
MTIRKMLCAAGIAACAAFSFGTAQAAQPGCTNLRTVPVVTAQAPANFGPYSYILKAGEIVEWIHGNREQQVGIAWAALSGPPGQYNSAFEIPASGSVPVLFRNVEPVAGINAAGGTAAVISSTARFVLTICN